MTDFWSQIYTMVQSGKSEEVTDLIWKTIDDYLLDGKFSECNVLLMEANLEKLNTQVLIDLLTATLPAKNKLSYRPKLLYLVVRYLMDRNSTERVDNLMKGLV